MFLTRSFEPNIPHEAIRDNGKSKSWKGIHGLCENFNRQSCNYPGEDTIDEVKAKIEESYFDPLQTDLKVKSKQGRIQDFF